MIRKIEEKDIEQCLNIYNFYIKESTATFECDTLNIVEFKERIKRIVKNFRYLVYEYENKVLGYAYLDYFIDRKAAFMSADLSIYSRVNEAISRVNSIDKELYENYNKVEKALYQIDWNKSKQEQAIVDSYADTINKAIEGLVKKNKHYKVTEGETFVKESGKDISIRIDHEYTENVKVDDQ